MVAKSRRPTPFQKAQREAQINAKTLQRHINPAHLIQVGNDRLKPLNIIDCKPAAADHTQVPRQASKQPRGHRRPLASERTRPAPVASNHTPRADSHPQQAMAFLGIVDGEERLITHVFGNEQEPTYDKVMATIDATHFITKVEIIDEI